MISLHSVVAHRYVSYMLYYFNKKNYGYFIGKVMDDTGASRAEVTHTHTHSHTHRSKHTHTHAHTHTHTHTLLTSHSAQPCKSTDRGAGVFDGAGRLPDFTLQRGAR
jgi:hypothetical protein